MKVVWIIIKYCFLFSLFYTALVVFTLLFFRVIDPPVSAFIYSNSDPVTEVFSYSDIKQKSVSIQNMSRYVPLAVMASEDQTFFDHFGFDFNQIEKAMKENKHRKRARGASTISMQLAKNLFLWNGRLIFRKGLEAYYTLLIELLWSKERILETYCNLAEMGTGIFGIEAAARTYYKKDAIKLNSVEAATIVATLPNPKKRDPRKPSGYLIKRRNNILEQMNLIGGVSILKEKISY
jgi:monofunctional glycosyltransferase